MFTDRRRGRASDALISVTLTNKYAEVIDGVDLSRAQVGDHLRLPAREAALLIAEGWAVARRDRVNAERGESGIERNSRAAAASEAPRRIRYPTVSTKPPLDSPRPTAVWTCGQNGPSPGPVQHPAEQTKV